MAEVESVEEELRGLLRRERQGLLSTISLHRPGWPFGSLAPYALSARGTPLLLLSSIAEHTRNLTADGRASLLVQARERQDDPQAGARATILGDVRPVEAASRADARARYLARHPEAQGYFAAHDFSLFELSLEEVRYIGGFGRIHWVAGERVAQDPESDPLRASERSICEHMNEDHAETLALLCGAPPGTGARMAALDQWGFSVELAAGVRVRIDFERPLTTPALVRAELIERAKRATPGGLPQRVKVAVVGGEVDRAVAADRGRRVDR